MRYLGPLTDSYAAWRSPLLLGTTLICAVGSLAGCGDTSSGDAVSAEPTPTTGESFLQITFACDPVDPQEFRRVIPAGGPDAAWRANMPDDGWYWLVASFGGTRASWLIQESPGDAVTVLAGDAEAQQRTPEAPAAESNAPEEYALMRDSAVDCLNDVDFPTDVS